MELIEALAVIMRTCANHDGRCDRCPLRDNDNACYVYYNYVKDWKVATQPIKVEPRVFID